ncbi:NAD-dependent epimerase/dehydratase family protein [Nonomuraea sp. B19D2]|uniref:NAD-dependent epimerase/dehydratase family protein n=1 Tax=Nonomuraea sp. B19D2 TaxID=3159561 RepID=UPI0032DA6CDE
MKVLVAGATGAIGRPLVAALREAGQEVLALTRHAHVSVPGARTVVADVLDVRMAAPYFAILMIETSMRPSDPPTASQAAIAAGEPACSAGWWRNESAGLRATGETRSRAP